MAHEKLQGPRHYKILSKRCVWGSLGEVVVIDLTPGQELCAIQAGVIEIAARPTVAAEKKGK